jgi:hypothetical protein
MSNWMKTVGDALPPMEKEPFAPRATGEEKAAGFKEIVVDNPNQYALESNKIRIVVRPLGNGRRAVKLSVGGGYAIMDAQILKPVDEPAHNLAELLQRFPLMTVD